MPKPQTSDQLAAHNAAALAVAWEKWKSSEDGMLNFRVSTLLHDDRTRPPNFFLENRLRSAFMQGAMIGAMNVPDQFKP